MQKSEPKHRPYALLKINPKCIIHLNANNIWPWFGDEFSDITPKPYVQKKKVDKLDFFLNKISGPWNTF